jgi:hypothetical protein
MLTSAPSFHLPLFFNLLLLPHLPHHSFLSLSQSRITEMGSVQWARGSTGGGEGLKPAQVAKEGEVIGAA